MDENRRDDAEPPEWFVNTATAPRWAGVAGALAMIPLSLLLVWAAASNPLFGLGLDHPATLVFGGLIVCLWLGLAVYVWRQSDEAWRRVPDGPLSPEFRALADAGRVQEAMARLREETGAGFCEARQVVELYLARRARRLAEPGSAADGRA